MISSIFRDSLQYAYNLLIYFRQYESKISEQRLNAGHRNYSIVDTEFIIPKLQEIIGSLNYIGDIIDPLTDSVPFHTKISKDIDSEFKILLDQSNLKLSTEVLSSIIHYLHQIVKYTYIIIQSVESGRKDYEYPIQPELDSLLDLINSVKSTTLDLINYISSLYGERLIMKLKYTSIKRK